MRKAIEVAFELKNGGDEQMMGWLWRQRSAGKSFRVIADELTMKVGIPVSHESVRQWLKAG
jgi:hypothetical protein